MNPEWNKPTQISTSTAQKKHLDIAFALENLQIIADQELLERGVNHQTWGTWKSESGEAEKFNHHDLWGWSVIYEYDWICMIGKLVHN